MTKQRAWAEISLDALDYNYKIIRDHINVKYLAVVKANAYGHGDIAIAKELQKLGADWFGVATLGEGIALREHGIERPILIFGYTPADEAYLLAQHSLTQALFSEEYARCLKDYAVRQGVTVQCHLKLDTGMGRIGFSTADKSLLLRELDEIFCRHIQITGVFTHFAVADELSEISVEFTNRQLQKFTETCDMIEAKGYPLGIRHCANSAGGIQYPNARLDMVRVGIAQYGFAPSDELRDKLALQPLMTLCSTVAMVKEISEGDSLSYGRIYIAKQKRKIATITIGYADGYPRKLGGAARVIINGEYAPVVGRVCMDQLMADVTDIPEVKMGDEVILAGVDGKASISFEELASLTDTVHYERVCAISPRVPRIYVRNGEIVEQ